MVESGNRNDSVKTPPPIDPSLMNPSAKNPNDDFNSSVSPNSAHCSTPEDYFTPRTHSTPGNSSASSAFGSPITLWEEKTLTVSKPSFPPKESNPELKSVINPISFIVDKSVPHEHPAFPDSNPSEDKKSSVVIPCIDMASHQENGKEKHSFDENSRKTIVYSVDEKKLLEEKPSSPESNRIISSINPTPEGSSVGVDAEKSVSPSGILNQVNQSLKMDGESVMDIDSYLSPVSDVCNEHFCRKTLSFSAWMLPPVESFISDVKVTEVVDRNSDVVKDVPIANLDGSKERETETESKVHEGGVDPVNSMPSTHMNLVKSDQILQGGNQGIWDVEKNKEIEPEGSFRGNEKSIDDEPRMSSGKDGSDKRVGGAIDSHESLKIQHYNKTSILGSESEVMFEQNQEIVDKEVSSLSVGETNEIKGDRNGREVRNQENEYKEEACKEKVGEKKIEESENDEVHQSEELENENVEDKNAQHDEIMTGEDQVPEIKNSKEIEIPDDDSKSIRVEPKDIYPGSEVIPENIESKELKTSMVTCDLNLAPIPTPVDFVSHTDVPPIPSCSPAEPELSCSPINQTSSITSTVISTSIPVICEDNSLSNMNHSPINASIQILQKHDDIAFTADASMDDPEVNFTANDENTNDGHNDVTDIPLNDTIQTTNNFGPTGLDNEYPSTKENKNDPIGVSDDANLRCFESKDLDYTRNIPDEKDVVKLTPVAIVVSSSTVSSSIADGRVLDDDKNFIRSDKDDQNPTNNDVNFFDSSRVNSIACTLDTKDCMTQTDSAIDMTTDPYSNTIVNTNAISTPVLASTSTVAPLPPASVPNEFASQNHFNPQIIPFEGSKEYSRLEAKCQELEFQIANFKKKISKERRKTKNLNERLIKSLRYNSYARSQFSISNRLFMLLKFRHAHMSIKQSKKAKVRRSTATQEKIENLIVKGKEEMKIGIGTSGILESTQVVTKKSEKEVQISGNEDMVRKDKVENLVEEKREVVQQKVVKRKSVEKQFKVNERNSGNPNISKKKMKKDERLDAEVMHLGDVTKNKAYGSDQVTKSVAMEKIETDLENAAGENDDKTKKRKRKNTHDAQSVAVQEMEETRDELKEMFDKKAGDGAKNINLRKALSGMKTARRMAKLREERNKILQAIAKNEKNVVVECDEEAVEQAEQNPLEQSMEVVCKKKGGGKMKREEEMKVKGAMKNANGKHVHQQQVGNQKENADADLEGEVETIHRDHFCDRNTCDQIYHNFPIKRIRRSCVKYGRHWIIKKKVYYGMENAI